MKHYWMLLAVLGSPAALAHEGALHGTHVAQAPAAAPEQMPWGIAGQAATRTVTLDMLDTMRFEPDHLVVAEGETVRFVIHNRGRMLHEMVIGTLQALAEHAAVMAKHPNMAHDAPYIAHVAPGETGEIVWTFNRAGNFEFACLLPGHYEAGMRGRIDVAPAPIATLPPTGAAAAPTAPAQTPSLAEGVVRKVDRASGKVTLRHGAIPNLDMPPMTMVYSVSELALLDHLQAGDRVRFEASDAGGTYTVTRMERLP